MEEALLAEPGESYQDLKQRFGLSIGAMKRHRKGHLGGEWKSSADQSSVADELGDEVFSEETYLRFGAAPEGGTTASWNPLAQRSEEGLSVFDALKGSRGNYILDLYEVEAALQQLISLAYLIGARRRVYEAAGVEVGAGSDGEPLLAEGSASLKPIPLRARVHLPEWLGEEGKKLETIWNRLGNRGAKTKPDRALMNQGVRIIVAAGEVLHPHTRLEDRATRTRDVRSVFAPEVKQFMGWK